MFTLTMLTYIIKVCNITVLHGNLKSPNKIGCHEITMISSIASYSMGNSRMCQMSLGNSSMCRLLWGTVT